MPTYDYRCAACGHALEVFHSISAPPRRKCPGCGKNRLERQIGTGAGFIFKGSGFYQTDYRSESYRAAAKADAGSASTPTPPADAAKADAPKGEVTAAEKGSNGKAEPAKPPEAKSAAPAKDAKKPKPRRARE